MRCEAVDKYGKDVIESWLCEDCGSGWPTAARPRGRYVHGACSECRTVGYLPYRVFLPPPPVGLGGHAGAAK